MDFRTVIPIKHELNIDHQSKVLMFGSCFSENIGRKLEEYKFPVLCNPVGILFNPASIAQSVRRIKENRKVELSELFEVDGLWNSFEFHGKFAKVSPTAYLDDVNGLIANAHQFLASCGFIFITLGTAWVYEEKASGEIVGNCHKVPACNFNRRRLSVESCFGFLKGILEDVATLNPEAQVIFTVSPIRHWKDGAHGNQISKSTLLLAVERVCEEFAQCHYFPSYEIMMDDLRDYRFYADDMLHPSEQAQTYIWERFSECYFSDETIQLNRQIKSVCQALQHRPLNPESEAFKRFKLQTAQQVCDLVQKYPFLSF